MQVNFVCGSISRDVNLWAGNEYKGLVVSEYLFLKIYNKIKSRVAWSFLRRLEDQKQKINFVWPKIHHHAHKCHGSSIDNHT